MKIALAICVFSFVFIGEMDGDQEHPKDICGYWFTPEEEAKIQVYQKNRMFYGKIVWQKNPYDKKGREKKDEKNPVDSLRNRSLHGMDMMGGFLWNEKDKWEKGWVYDPETGHTYQAKISMDGYNVLKLRGYYGISLIGKTCIWTRAR